MLCIYGFVPVTLSLRQFTEFLFAFVSCIYQ